MIPVDQRNTRRVREWGLGAQAPQRRPWHLPRLSAVVLPRKRGVLRGVEGSLQPIGDAAAVEIGQVKLSNLDSGHGVYRGPRDRRAARRDDDMGSCAC